VLTEKQDGLMGEIRALCLRRLPVFARPSRITVMEKFPQLPSGKVDRMALLKTPLG
jgi:acyl-CoA synthetase (AMP-forming)/AMP-acid ligase II